MHAASHRSRFLPLMAALTATAWLTLWVWGQSPYMRYLDHGSWTEIGVAGSLPGAPGRRCGADGIPRRRRLDADARSDDAADDPAAARHLPAFDDAARRSAVADGTRGHRLSRGLGRLWSCRPSRRLGGGIGGAPVRL